VLSIPIGGVAFETPATGPRLPRAGETEPRHRRGDPGGDRGEAVAKGLHAYPLKVSALEELRETLYRHLAPAQTPAAQTSFRCNLVSGYEEPYNVNIGQPPRFAPRMRSAYPETVQPLRRVAFCDV
jgi:hypothetical protein